MNDNAEEARRISPDEPVSTAFGVLDTTKAREELGWMPRPMAETVSDSIAWFAQRKAVADVGMAPIFGRW